MLVLAHADDERHALVPGFHRRGREEEHGKGRGNEAHHGASTFPLFKSGPRQARLKRRSTTGSGFREGRGNGTVLLFLP